MASKQRGVRDRESIAGGGGGFDPAASTTLYVDNNIEYGGRIVGGIRIRAARTNGAARSEQQASRVPYQSDEFDDEITI